MLVAAVKGPVRVFNQAGLLVANVAANTTLRFEPQAGSQDAFGISGCLLRKAGKLIVVDQTTNQIVELRGDAAKLAAQAVVGADPAGRAPEAAAETPKGHGALIAGVAVAGAGDAMAGHRRPKRAKPAELTDPIHIHPRHSPRVGFDTELKTGL